MDDYKKAIDEDLERHKQDNKVKLRTDLESRKI